MFQECKHDYLAWNFNRYSIESKPGTGPGSPASSELIIQQVSLSDRGDVECVAV